MIKAIEFPGRTFSTKEDLFSELKKHEKEIIGLKKSQVYKSSEKGQLSFLDLDLSKTNESVKSLFGATSGNIYPVISTTRYRDSHKDVHFDGCFSKTEREQQGKVYYALDHELKWNSILAWPKDVRMFISMLDWSDVGKSYQGQTQALIFEIPESKITNKDVLNAILNKVSNFENSIRMVYYKITLAINSNEKQYAENKAYFDSRINIIANKDEVLEDGYFYGVDELGIHKEGSLVVAGGSNDATSIIIPEADEISLLSKQDPVITSQQLKELINNAFKN